MTKRPTIKSIAQDLGISHMTVSRALTGSPLVQEGTKQKILKRANELGYVRSEAAVAMRGDATRIVGLILPNIENEFYASLANTMSRACDDVGLHLVIHLSDDDQAAERLQIQRLRQLHAFAVALVPAPGEPDSYPADVTSVELIRTRSGGISHMIDDADAIRSAVVHLTAAGHDRISFICGGEDLSSGRDRYGAFCDGMARQGVSVNDDLLIRGAPSKDLGRGLGRLLQEPNPPTAVICGGFEISNGALASVMDSGLRMPDDIAFVGYGDPQYYSWIAGGVTTIGMPVDAFANALAHRLSTLRRGTDPLSDAGDPTASFKAQLVTRNTA